jgi:transglycosylase-like protein with SLT domain
MKQRPLLALAAALSAALASVCAVHAGEHDYDALVASHAKANHVPESLVHRIIVRESKYHPELVGHGGTIGLMQIKLGTARGLGYTGDAAGLRDPATNLTYGVKYLAGAYRAARGDLELAVHYYAAGYYWAAKRLHTALAEAKSPEIKSPDTKTPDQNPEAKTTEAGASASQPADNPQTAEASKPDESHPEATAAAPAPASAAQSPSNDAPRKKATAKTKLAHAPSTRPLVIVPVTLRTAKPR